MSEQPPGDEHTPPDGHEVSPPPPPAVTEPFPHLSPPPATEPNPQLPPPPATQAFPPVNPYPQYGQQSYGQPQYGQQPHGQPQYGQPVYGYGPTGPSNDGTAVAVLVLGIVSLVLLVTCIGIIPGIIALCLAPSARRNIAGSGGRLTGEGMVKGGVICAWISIAVTVVSVVGYIGFLIVLFATT